MDMEKCKCRANFQARCGEDSYTYDHQCLEACPDAKVSILHFVIWNECYKYLHFQKDKCARKGECPSGPCPK